MTEKLYYEDSHIKSFTAKVLSCEQVKNGYELILDKTAFFPEGGGQSGDSGYIGSVRVFDTHEKNGVVVHYAEDAVTVGEEYDCRIDWEQRFRRMQNHSGEHIVSGIVNRKYGYSNVGFHMGSDFVTIDFDGHLSPVELSEIEREANYAVAENRRIITSFPDEETIKSLDYRSKLDLTENVRIVEIEGIDLCACCAPHVYATAEIGIIKILGSERRRRGGDGVRVTMLCGLDAYDNFVLTHNNNVSVSMQLSAKREETAAAVERLLNEHERLKARSADLGMALSRCMAKGADLSKKNVVYFDDMLDEPALRELINLTVPECEGIACVFSGSDETGYRYIMGSRSVDLRASAKKINAALGGRGGGSPEMIQGSCTAKRENIEELFAQSMVFSAD